MYKIVLMTLMWGLNVTTVSYVMPNKLSSVRPRCVPIHDNGDIYVGSHVGCIYAFDQTGQLKNTIGSRGSKGDVLYVADTGSHHVQKLTATGKFLHKFGQKG